MSNPDKDAPAHTQVDDFVARYLREEAEYRELAAQRIEHEVDPFVATANTVAA